MNNNEKSDAARVTERNGRFKQPTSVSEKFIFRKMFFITITIEVNILFRLNIFLMNIASAAVAVTVTVAHDISQQSCAATFQTIVIVFITNTHTYICLFLFMPNNFPIAEQSPHLRQGCKGYEDLLPKLFQKGFWHNENKKTNEIE